MCVCSVVRGEIWTLLTGGDRHRRTHAQAHKQTREVDCERGKKEELNTSDCLQLPQLQPTPSTQTHTSPQSHQANASAGEDPAWSREHFPRDISDVHMWANTLRSTHTNWCHVSHHWFSLFSFRAGLPVYFSSLSSRSQRCSSEPWKPTGLVVLSFLYSISVFRTPRHNIIICM